MVKLLWFNFQQCFRPFTMVLVEGSCVKSQVSEDPSTSNMRNWPKHCWNLNHSTFTIFIDTCKENQVWKNLWEIWKILGLFVNTLTANDKYSLLNRGNLLQHFQMQWYQKRKSFPDFFFTFSKFRFNFDHSHKKGWPSQLRYFWT